MRLRRSAVLLTLAASLCAQGPVSLVRDLNVLSAVPGLSSSPRREECALAVGGSLFVASDPLHGIELWQSDGTAAGTSILADIVPGPASSNPSQLTSVGNSGVVLFVATDPACGLELWRTDGTAAGTYMLKDIHPGAIGSNPTGLRRAGLLPPTVFVYFSADDGTHGRELWRTDGTSGGTVLVVDLRPGSASGMNTASLIHAHAVNGQVVGAGFSGDDGIVGEELWTEVQGSVALFADIRPGPLGSMPREMGPGGFPMFSADDGTRGRELWRHRTDGVHLLADINPGLPSSNPSDFWLASVPGGHRVFFAATTALTGRELWQVDVATESVTPVQDINPGPASSSPELFLPLSTGIVFAATTPSLGRELWRSDGTPAGTVLVKDIQPGSGSSTPTLLDGHGTAAGTLNLFEADDGSLGRELWVTDGTAGGTTLVKDIQPGPGSSFPYWVGGLSGTSVSLIAANDGVHGVEPWLTDWTPAGTSLLRDLAQDPGGSAPRDLVALGLGPTLLFAASDGLTGRELWRTDGTAVSTVLVRDIYPGPGNAQVQNLFAHGGRVYFSAVDGATGLEPWTSDGTFAGTALLKDVRAGSASSAPRDFIALPGGAVCFVTDDGISGRELWKTDGTPAGTVLLRDINPGVASSSPVSLVVLGSTLYFTARTANEGLELWRSDGTSAGTVLVRDINPGPADSATSAADGHELFVYGSLLLFRATDGLLMGAELWKSDGTTAGTVLVRNIAAVGDSSPGGFAELNGLVCFAATDTAGRELWKTNGTLAGTLPVRDIAAGPGSSSPRALTAVNGKLLFAAEQPATGLELWQSDGTLAGTTLLEDIDPGCVGGIWEPAAPEVVRFGTLQGAQKAVFAASDGVGGVEVWVSDGTAAGTVRHTDLNPGAQSANPGVPVLAGSRLYFAASEGTTGLELYSMTAMAAVFAYGQACPGTRGQLPRLSGGGTPYLGNAAFRVLVGNALPNSAAILLAGFGPADLPIGGGCRLHVDLSGPFLVLSGPTGARGDAAINLPIPRDLSLVGLQVFAQADVLDPGGAFQGVLSVTGGLAMILAVD